MNCSFSKTNSYFVKLTNFNMNEWFNDIHFSHNLSIVNAFTTTKIDRCSSNVFNNNKLNKYLLLN